MRDKEREILEVIDGFKILTYKIKKDNDVVKQTVKNKDAIIASCKTEYQKLYSEYNELQERYNELENYILQLQQQQQQQQQQLEKAEQLQQQQQQQSQITKKNIPFYANKKRKHYLMNYDDDDDDDDDNDNDRYNQDDDTNENEECEYIKIRKKPKNKKIKKTKGIIEYINSNN